jgi:hypothetical protein
LEASTSDFDVAVPGAAMVAITGEGCSVPKWTVTRNLVCSCYYRPRKRVVSHNIASCAHVPRLASAWTPTRPQRKGMWGSRQLVKGVRAVLARMREVAKVAADSSNSSSYSHTRRSS